MKAIIAMLGLGISNSRVNHLWLVEGEKIPASQLIDIESDDRFVEVFGFGCWTVGSDRSDISTRLALSLCGRNRAKMKYLFNHWTRVCLLCQAVAKDLKLEGTHYNWYHPPGEWSGAGRAWRS
jgi:hypothetical protein